MGLRNMAFTGRAKIIKPNGEAPDDFGPQESPSGAEHYCCQGSRCRRRQKGHCYLHARSTEEVLWQACGLYRPKKDFAQANQESEQAKAEASTQSYFGGCSRCYPRRPCLPCRNCRQEN